jgi:enoyl-CoA hydratase/3-hydroxyacyl-CoA dehydrogenase
MLGKVVIVCADRPGFVVNRFFVPWLNEACLLLEEDVATAAQIDAAARKAFRIGLGPFGLMNLTGPPIALHSTDYLSEQLHTPRYNGAQNLRDLIDANEQWSIEGEESYSDEQYVTISERLYGVVFGVAAQIVDEGVCSMEDVDRGAKVGLRWARGPFELMNKVGVQASCKWLNPMLIWLLNPTHLVHGMCRTSSSNKAMKIGLSQLLIHPLKMELLRSPSTALKQ